jgi:tetratricopeptide (TPR) repeat protein
VHRGPTAESTRRSGARSREPRNALRRIVDRYWTGAAIVAALVVIYYGGTLRNDLVWDDRLTAMADVGPTLQGPIGHHYRPLVMLSFAGDRMLWGRTPSGYHATNIACHVMVAWLLLSLARAIGLGPGRSLIAALLFAAHPVQTEAVSYVSGRTDVLCALFVLLACHAWRYSRRAIDGPAWASAAALGAALLCKESAVLAPLALFLILGARRAPLPILPLATVLLWFLAWQKAVAPELRLGDVLQRLGAVGAAAASYLRLLLWPSDLHIERFIAVAGWTPAATLGAWLAVILALGLLTASARRVPGGWFWLVLALALYAPVSGIVPVHPDIADRALFAPEHFLYLPLLGLAPLVAGGIAALPVAVPPLLMRAALVLLLAVWGTIVIDRNRDWRDEETLFRHALRYAPPTGRLWYNLGNIRLGAGDLAGAVELLGEAAKRSPNDAATQYNLGIALQRQGNLGAAETHYRRATTLDPGFANAYRALAAVLARRGEREEARRMWTHAERLRP